MAAEIVDWVSDELHDILGLSDRYIAEYLVGLARKASSTQNLITKLENTGAITVNEEVRQFYHQLDGDKIPHQAVSEKPARAKEREAKLQREQNKKYQLIMEDSDEDEPKHKRRKNSTSSRQGGH